MRCLPLRALHVSSLALLLGAFGCAAGDAERPPAKPPAAVKAAPPVPRGHLARADVDRVLVELGPPWLLRRVMRREVIRDDGKFAGWRLTGLPDEWSGIDLQPGDVVTRVNGKPLETPDQAWDAWKSVAKAREIKIGLLRNGAARELVIPIDGALDATVAKALERDAPPPRADRPPQRGVVQIGGGPSDDEDGETF